MSSLEDNQTWILVSLPDGRRVIRNKWVFKVKRNRDGNERFKARLVAKGYTQREGIDYTETYSPVVKHETIRILIAIASIRKLILTQFDVKTAFLYGNINEELYMEQPEGFDDGSGRVCQLKKGLYGLKQSPRAWNETIKEVLIKNGFTQLLTDNCVFVNKGKSIFLIIYVDDGLIFSHSKEEANLIIKLIQQTFELTVSEATQYIGLEIDQEEEAIYISQQRYTEKILQQFDMSDCNPVKTPSTSDTKPCDVPTTAPYKEAVGALMYLSNVSRPDISFATGKVARRVSNPSTSDWLDINRMFLKRRSPSDRDHF